MKASKVVCSVFVSFLFFSTVSAAQYSNLQIKFQRACLANLIEDVVECLNEDPELVHLEYPYKMTALHYAAGKGYLELAKVLKQRGADVNVRDIDLKTPIHHAAFFQHKEMVRWFLRQGAVQSLDKNGEYPIENAIKPQTLVKSMQVLNEFYEYNRDLTNWNHMRRFIEKLQLESELEKELQNLCIYRDYRDKFFTEIRVE